MLNRTARAAGFSLVEVLLVIVIILMLAGSLVYYVLPQQEGAERSTTRLKLQNIRSALDLYRVTMRSYPTEEQGGLQALLKKPMLENQKLAENWAGPYVDAGTTFDDAWGNLIRYELVDKSLEVDKTGPDYRLYSVGPDGLPDTEDDIRLVEKEDPLDPTAAGNPAGTPAPVTPQPSGS